MVYYTVMMTHGGNQYTIKSEIAYRLSRLFGKEEEDPSERTRRRAAFEVLRMIDSSTQKLGHKIISQ